MTDVLNIINNVIVKYAGISNLLTIIITVLGAIYITGKLNRKKIEKIRFELSQKYANALFEKRVDVYPSLSAILCGYQKIMLSKKNDGNNFRVFLEMLEKWNTKNSLYFSKATAHFSEMSRLYFRHLKAKLDNQNESEPHGNSDNELTEDDWKDIYQILGDFEVTLRADIGTYHEKLPGKAEDVKTIIDSLEKKLTDIPDHFTPFSN